MEISSQRRQHGSRLAASIIVCFLTFALLVTGIAGSAPTRTDRLAAVGLAPGSAFAQSPVPGLPQPSPSPTKEPPPPPPSEPQRPSHPALPEGSGEGRRVVYSNSQQRVWLVEDSGEISGSWLVSGRKGMPRAGTYKVFSKSRHSSASRGRLRMQYMVRFARGRRLAIGFHSIPVTRRGGRPIQSESELGQYRSSGCVRQRLSDAQALWDWAPKGTKVVVTR